jgi:hypothetical protein
VTCSAVSCMSTGELHELVYAPHTPTVTPPTPTVVPPVDLTPMPAAPTVLPGEDPSAAEERQRPAPPGPLP